MKANNKIKTYAIILLSIAFVINTPILFLGKLEDQRQYEAYLNEFYHELNSTLSLVDYLLTNEVEGRILTNRLRNIDENLETIKLLLRLGDRTINSNIKSQPRFFVGRIIHSQDNEEGRLTDEQKVELKQVQKGLSYMKEGLYSEETGQENKGLSPKKFSEVIEKGANIGE